MKVIRNAIAGVGMTAAATAMLLAATPAANAATDKVVNVWVHSYTNGVKIAVEACSDNQCSSSEQQCFPIGSRKTAQWVNLDLKLRPGFQLRGFAFNDTRCAGDPTQASKIHTVPNDNSPAIWVSLG